MTRLSRIVLLAVSAGLLAMLVLPIWSIHLQAPQYPEGLGMHVWLGTVRGIGQHDLANINELNHYIGMKRIEPDTIAELRFMPLLVAGMAALGLLAGALGRRWLLYAWSVLFIAMAAAGLGDFYRWLYDYGHDLAPDAAIQVPGMVYTPPLIGSKTLLNFTAVSWPAAGGWIAIAAGAAAAYAVVHEMRVARRAAAA
ncbi:MAG TPA: hypothetical protein VFL93_03785 [Longimicrobiaceae bacterium]|nr:hypothetical protein [Longimicrobiaceae bacterium]